MRGIQDAPSFGCGVALRCIARCTFSCITALKKPRGARAEISVHGSWLFCRAKERRERQSRLTTRSREPSTERSIDRACRPAAKNSWSKFGNAGISRKNTIEFQLMRYNKLTEMCTVFFDFLRFLSAAAGVRIFINIHTLSIHIYSINL